MFVVLCQTTLTPFWTSVILSETKNPLVRREILLSTQNDSQRGAMKLDKGVGAD